MRSQSIVDFRYRQLGAAKVNAAQYNLSGALYPWTGARFGNCTGVGPVCGPGAYVCKYQTDPSYPTVLRLVSRARNRS